ncbi:MAG TPA: PIG-L family deacetylase [Verrucomicrobiae bacterium]|nr:PIG-L family deacetylase [Verrucomicrobiae bacterium]
MKKAPAAIAIAAHPDDIEFYMAGTLLLLRDAGYETHYWNLASGNCGSAEQTSARTRRQRAQEARAAARVLGAKFHPSITDDLQIFYEAPLLRRVSALLRDVRPQIILTHSPQDYMEDHTNTARLAVTAAFARGMPNFGTRPPREAFDNELAIYHAMPHGLRDPLRRRVIPGQFVDTGRVHDRKTQALACHQSQQKWLDLSQGLNSYLGTMEETSLEVGRLSGKFRLAEGWRRHLHLGFSARDFDPLSQALGKLCRINADYERSLNRLK